MFSKAVNFEESSIPDLYFSLSLTPPQSAGNAIAEFNRAACAAACSSEKKQATRENIYCEC